MRQEEAEAGLHREGRPHVAAIAEFADGGAELGAVGHDREAPDEAERGQEAGGAEQEPGAEGAASRHDQARDRDRRSSEAVRQASCEDAPQSAHGHDGEARDARALRAPAGRFVARQEAERGPGPHRVELPHVPEVAQVGEPDPGGGHGSDRLAPVEATGGADVGADPDGEDQEPTQDREPRSHEEDRAPRGEPGLALPGEGVQEVRQGRADGQGTNQDAQPEAAVFLAPGGGQLHTGGIDPGQEEPGQEAERQGRLGARDPERDRPVAERARERAARDQALGREAVGGVGEGAREGAGYEADLDRHREPGLEAPAQVPGRRQLGEDRAGREPKRHRQQLGQGQEEQDPPLARGLRRSLAHDPPWVRPAASATRAATSWGRSTMGQWPTSGRRSIRSVPKRLAKRAGM